MARVSELCAENGPECPCAPSDVAVAGDSDSGDIVGAVRSELKCRNSLTELAALAPILPPDKASSSMASVDIDTAESGSLSRPRPWANSEESGDALVSSSAILSVGFSKPRPCLSSWISAALSVPKDTDKSLDWVERRSSRKKSPSGPSWSVDLE